VSGGQGQVYFLQSSRGGPIKIGYTSGDVMQRVRSMQTASPHRLVVIASAPGSREDERGLHGELANQRMVGEWFRDCREVRDAIRAFAGTEPGKPKVRMLPCGCVAGYSFCAEADEIWRNVGLARARDDIYGYGDALRAFGEHLPTSEMEKLRLKEFAA
jgi:hypothetical protein